MANAQLDISARLRGVGHVLRDLTLRVPPFQRNYSWTTEQVDEYWYDLRAALSADQRYYFFGTVVVSGGDDQAALVIDGQQRLATTTLLLAAIRDEFAERGEHERASGIQSRYLEVFSLVKNANEPRLQLNEADQTYFSEAVLNAGDAAAAKGRKTLASAYAHLKDHVHAETEAAGPYFVDRLLKWVNYLDQGAQVILMETADESDAFMVFETLNDRGLPLAVADVIKNYLLSVARDRLSEASEYWVAAVQAIEESQDSDRITDYLRHSWNSSNGATRERDLYGRIRTQIRSETQSIAYLERLAAQAPLYVALTDFSNAIWDGEYQLAGRAAQVLEKLGLEQYKPLALAALANLSGQQTEDILRGSVNWSTRSLIAGGGGGGTAERLYSEAAVRVTNGRSTSARSVFEDLEPLIPTNSEFRAAFANRRIHRLSTIHYLLSALRDQNSIPQDSGDYVVVPLLPRQDKHGQWRSFGDPDEMREAAALLGNWTLVPRAQAANVPINPEERFRFLEDFNRRDANWVELSVESLKDRQQRMAAESLFVWPVVPSEAADVS